MKPVLIILPLAIISLITACATTRPGPEITKDGVLFSFYGPNAKDVAIAGNFNAWDARKDKLTGPDRQGYWRLIIPLHEGRYEYLFIINGKNWQPDPAVPEVDDGFGGKNSVLIVP